MALKEAGGEADRVPQSPLVNQFIETELKRLTNQTQNYQNSPASFEVLDEIFRTTLREAHLLEAGKEL